MLRMDRRSGEMMKLGDLSLVFFSSAARSRLDLGWCDGGTVM